MPRVVQQSFLTYFYLNDLKFLDLNLDYPIPMIQKNKNKNYISQI
jgi:hypothetical protein